MSSDIKITKGQHVLVAFSNEQNTTGKWSWGVRVFDPEWSARERQEDVDRGEPYDDAGEPKLYSDVREYIPALDGEGLLLKVEELRAKKSYQSVRGVYFAPTSLVKARTPNGRVCWFRVHDVIAVTS